MYITQLKFRAFSTFFGYKDQQRTTAATKNIFKDTSTMVGTQLICSSETAHLLFITCKELLSALKTSVSPLSKKSISHENLGFCIVSVS